MIALARFFEWREALVIVKPETFIRWHRTAFRAFWHWKSRRPGRPSLPLNLRELIREMAAANPSWGEGRIADELSLKLGALVSPRTVGKYLRLLGPPGSKTSNQRWATFVRNHAKGIVACDFMVSVTASMRVLYVFIAMEVGSRRILHTNVTAHPTAEWTLQQFREAFPWETAPRYLLRDRDRIFGDDFNKQVREMGIKPVLSAPRSPWQRAYVERVIGTIRRECLDHVIVFNEASLYRQMQSFVAYYHESRTHLSLAKDAPESRPVEAPALGRIAAIPQVGGLHHRYERRAA